MGLGRFGGVPGTTNFVRTFRTYMERDPIVLFSCIIGGFGFAAPFIVGDGGRNKEELATTYAYRIKHVYPNEAK